MFTQSRRQPHQYLHQKYWFGSQLYSRNTENITHISDNRQCGAKHHPVTNLQIINEYDWAIVFQYI